ncbi:MAG: Protease 3 [Chlamydiales bacterium]|nr:Protease 3 [Chlamydiales bacterium]
MNKILVATLLLTTGFCHEVIEDRSNLKIETPSLAKREVRKIRLENGLEAVLISDPDTNQSGAALAAAVGSWDDPSDRPGMAHFVEHLLFLGTEKYPEEEGYTRYLDEHGGSRNAFTMADRTVYMFSVNNNGFTEALDRFGQFFVAPLFSPSGVDRECKAIHQEFCKDVPLDPWRVHYVKKALANQDHPFHRFCIGNSDTLAQISQDELKEWYRAHYSSHLMHLVVYSSQDLDALEEEVVSVFSEVKSTEHAPVPCSASIHCSENCDQMIAIAPVQDLQVLELNWELPRFFGTDKQTHADKLVSHVLGHEGATSLLAQLKRENLAESVSTGSHRAGKDQSLFTLSVHLTEEGVKKYETVIERCFEAIATLRKSGIPRYVYDEIADLEELKYRFQSREGVFELVTNLVVQLVDEPIETFPRQTLIPSQYAPEKVHELLACMTPHTCQFTLVAPPQLSQLKPTAKEKWLGVDYTLRTITAEKLDQWAQAQPHFHMSIPRPNPFLPQTLNVSGTQTDVKRLPHPTLIVDSPLGKMYACGDERYLVPEVTWTFTIKTPLITPADPKSLALADLYCHAVNEKLNATAYEAMMAGLSYSLKSTQTGLVLTLTGYQDKADAFLKTILTTMHNTHPTAAQFALYRAQLARATFNQANVSPIKQGSEQLWSILYKEYAGMSERSALFNRTTFKQFNTFNHSLFNTSYIEGMLYGNGDTSKVWESFQQTIAHAPFPPNRHPHKELATLPGRDRPSYLAIKSEHPANALILTADCGEFTFPRRAAQEILAKGLEEPFFSELRTKQQTAYLVANWAQELERHLYAFFAIQSSSHDTRDLLARFELFLENSVQHLEESVIPRARFEAIQTALVDKLDHPAETLPKMGALLHMMAFDYDADFDWLEKKKAAISSLTYEEFLAYSKEFLGKENPRRLALFVNGALPAAGRLSYKQITTPEKIRDEIAYKGRPVQESL